MFEPQEAVEVTVLASGSHFQGIVQYIDEHHLVIFCKHTDAACAQEGVRVQLVQVINNDFLLVDTHVVRCREGCLVVPVAPMQLVQRRRSPRISCDLAARYTQQLAENVAFRIDDPFAPEARVRDISQGGARVRAARFLPPNTRIEIEIVCQPSQSVVARAEVVRSLPHEVGLPDYPSLTYEIALRFLQVSRLHQVQLQRFLQSQGSAEPGHARTGAVHGGARLIHGR